MISLCKIFAKALILHLTVKTVCIKFDQKLIGCENV